MRRGIPVIALLLVLATAATASAAVWTTACVGPHCSTQEAALDEHRAEGDVEEDVAGQHVGVEFEAEADLGPGSLHVGDRVPTADVDVCLGDACVEPGDAPPLGPLPDAEDLRVATGVAPDDRTRRSDAGAPPTGFQTTAGPLGPVDPGRLDARRAWTLLGLTAAAAAGVVLYRRLRRDELLDNDLRSRLMARIRDEPGISPTEAAAELDVALNTVIYHVRILEDHGLVSSRRVDRRRLLFDATRLGPLRQAVGAALRSPTKRSLLELVDRRPGVGLSEAARRLDRHRSTIKHHVDDLAASGVVETRRDGDVRRVRLSDGAREMIAGGGP